MAAVWSLNFTVFESDVLGFDIVLIVLLYFILRAKFLYCTVLYLEHRQRNKLTSVFLSQMRCYNYSFKQNLKLFRNTNVCVVHRTGPKTAPCGILSFCAQLNVHSQLQLRLFVAPYLQVQWLNNLWTLCRWCSSHSFESTLSSW